MKNILSKLNSTFVSSKHTVWGQTFKLKKKKYKISLGLYCLIFAHTKLMLFSAFINMNKLLKKNVKFKMITGYYTRKMLSGLHQAGIQCSMQTYFNNNNKNSAESKQKY